MLDALQLQEQLVGVLILAAAELAAVVAEHGIDPRPCSSKVGRTSLFRVCTAVTGILLV